MTQWPRWGRSSGRKSWFWVLEILAFISCSEVEPDIEQEIPFGYSLYYPKNTKIQMGFFRKKKMKGISGQRPLIFFFKQLFFQKWSLSQFGLICTPLWIPPQPCSRKKRKEKETVLYSVLFCSTVTTFEIYCTLDYKTWKLK